MTDQIRRKLQDEMNQLEHELVHELPKEIKKAAALGDLSENAEYHMAKQRQEYLKARVRQLGKRLAELSMVNMNNIPKDKVGLGSTVKVFDNTKNEEMEYTLVTIEESDVAAGKISTTSDSSLVTRVYSISSFLVLSKTLTVEPSPTLSLGMLFMLTMESSARRLPSWRTRAFRYSWRCLAM